MQHEETVEQAKAVGQRPTRPCLLTFHTRLPARKALRAKPPSKPRSPEPGARAESQPRTHGSPSSNGGDVAARMLRLKSPARLHGSQLRSLQTPGPLAAARPRRGASARLCFRDPQARVLPQRPWEGGGRPAHSQGPGLEPAHLWRQRPSPLWRCLLGPAAGGPALGRAPPQQVAQLWDGPPHSGTLFLQLEPTELSDQMAHSVGTSKYPIGEGTF